MLLIIRSGKFKKVLGTEMGMAIQSLTNWVYVTPCMAMNINYSAVVEDACLNKQTRAWCYNRVAQLLKEGMSVVLVDEFIDKKSVKKYVSLSRDMQVEVSIINLDNKNTEVVRV